MGQEFGQILLLDTWVCCQMPQTARGCQGWVTWGQTLVALILSAGFLGPLFSWSIQIVGLGFLTRWRRQTSHMVTDWLSLRQKLQEVVRPLKGSSTGKSRRVQKKRHRLLSLSGAASVYREGEKGWRPSLETFLPQFLIHLTTPMSPHPSSLCLCSQT